jgi:hypothetical protein
MKLNKSIKLCKETKDNKNEKNCNNNSCSLKNQPLDSTSKNSGPLQLLTTTENINQEQLIPRKKLFPLFEEQYPFPPIRNRECCNYQECLTIAACLNWESFTCSGCNGTVDSQLQWQAGLSRRVDPICHSFTPRPKIEVTTGKRDTLDLKTYKKTAT